MELIEEMKKLSNVPMERRMMIARERRKEQVKKYESNNNNRDGGGGGRGRGRGGGGRGRGRGGAERSKKFGWEEGGGSRRIKFDRLSLLFELVNEGDVDGVRTLVSTNESLKDVTNCHGMTALHQSCINRNLGLIHLLVKELSADLSTPDLELWTPLHTVALLGYADVAKFLLDNGADPLALNLEQNMPYDICHDLDTLNIIEMRMVSIGATQEKIENLRMTKELQMLKEIQEAFQEDNSLMQKGPNDETLLHVTASLGYREVTEFLLSKTSISIDDVDKDGWQAIHCASYWNQLSVVEILIENGASIYSKTNENETALDLCRDESNKEWMRQKAVAENESVKKASSMKKYTRRASEDHFSSSHFDSLVSLMDLDKFSHSSKRLNAEMKKEKKKIDVKLEYQSLLKARPYESDLSTPPASPNSTNPLSFSTLDPLPETSKVVSDSSRPANDERKSAGKNHIDGKSRVNYISIYNNCLGPYDRLDSPKVATPKDNLSPHHLRIPPSPRDPQSRTPCSTPSEKKQTFIFPSQTSCSTPSEKKQTFMFPSQTSAPVSFDSVHDDDQVRRQRSSSKKTDRSTVKTLYESTPHTNDKAYRAGSLTTHTLGVIDIPRRANSTQDVSRSERDRGSQRSSRQKSKKQKKSKPSLKCIIS